MELIQTYQGYFAEDGRFIPDSLLAKIPIRRRAIVNVLDDEIVQPRQQTKTATIKGIIARALKAEDTLADSDWDEIANSRSATNAGMSRTVDL